jgi:hypothetical protein
MRTGLVELLVATAATLTPDELARLRSLPVGAAMLPGPIWRDHADAVVLLDDVDTTGPVTAVHPVDLMSAGDPGPRARGDRPAPAAAAGQAGVPRAVRADSGRT